MDTFIHDWTSFTLKIPINHDTDKIFSYFIKPEKLEIFFLENADFLSKNNASRDKESNIEKGDTYTWKWYGSSIMATGEVMSNNFVDECSFSFFNCLVAVKVFQQASVSIVELIQSNIPTDEESKVNLHIGCTRGWTFYLTNLKSILEGGIDLRNRDEMLGDVINT
jgi:hypothetical protein